MAYPKRIAITATGLTPALLDFFQSPFNTSIGVDVSGATGVTYGVQYTLSDFTGMLTPGGAAAQANVNPLWRNDTNLPPGQTTSGITNYQFPVIGVRLNVTAITSGTVYLEILQGMNAEG